MDRVPRIRLFGPGVAQAHPSEAPLPFGGPRQRALLTALALRPGRPVPVPDLVAALWGDDPPKTAHNALQVHISGLRHNLAPLGVGIHRDGATYRLGCGIGDVDVPLFDALVTSGQSMLRGGNPGQARTLLERALSLASAPLLAGQDVAPVLEQERRVLTMRLRSARRDLVIALYQDEEPQRAVEIAQSLVAEDPLDEAAWARLMIAQYHAGHPHDALEAYLEARTTLLEQLGIEPSPQLATLHQEILYHRVAGTAEDLPTRAVREPYEQAVSMCWLVQPLLMQGRLGEARACLDEGLELATRHRLGSAGVMFSADAALVELAEGKPAGAIGLATTVLAHLQPRLLPYWMAALRCLALGHEQLGNPHLGSRFLGAADAVAAQLGLTPDSQWVPSLIPSLQSLRASAGHAANPAVGAADPEAVARRWIASVEKA